MEGIPSNRDWTVLQAVLLKSLKELWSENLVLQVTPPPSYAGKLPNFYGRTLTGKSYGFTRHTLKLFSRRPLWGIKP
jgi:hypothetical protein